MASVASRLPARQATPQAIRTTSEPRIYSLCTFRSGLLVPEVSLFEAETDEEAVDFARTKGTHAEREVWDRHRLVAVLPASRPFETPINNSKPSE